MKKQKRKDQRQIVVDSRIYPLAAIYGAAYVFIDKAYILLGGDPNKKIIVSFKAKTGTTLEEFEEIIGNFENELLNYSLREQLLKTNNKVRENIIAQALLSPLYSFTELAEKARDEQYLEDPLGIGKTWEERFGKKIRIKK